MPDTSRLEADLDALCREIEQLRTRARSLHLELMRETEDAHPNPSLSLSEQGVRALGYAADGFRYARHNLKLTRLVHDGTVTLAQTGFASEERGEGC